MGENGVRTWKIRFNGKDLHFQQNRFLPGYFDGFSVGAKPGFLWLGEVFVGLLGRFENLGISFLLSSFPSSVSPFLRSTWLSAAGSELSINTLILVNYWRSIWKLTVLTCGSSHWSRQRLKKSCRPTKTHDLIYGEMGTQWSVSESLAPWLLSETLPVK